MSTVASVWLGAAVMLAIAIFIVLWDISLRPRSPIPRQAKLIIDAATLVAVLFYGGVTYFQWGAMIIANQQTKTALHVTERAYITAVQPTLDQPGKFIYFYTNNSGHLPSGKIEAVIHEATFNFPATDAPIDTKYAVEYHWKRHKLASLPPGTGLFRFVIPVRSLDDVKLSSAQGAYQTIFVAGSITYGDGFSDDPEQTWQFCFNTRFSIPLKTTLMVACDADQMIPLMEKLDGYPNNESTD
jgi:hypothetical protein